MGNNTLAQATGKLHHNPRGRIFSISSRSCWLKAHKLEVLLFILTFTSYSYFYNGAAWNHISRLNTIFSFVEPGTSDYLSFRINRFITHPEKGINTGDWAKYGENYYSNKAPGAALIGIPFYFFIYKLESSLNLCPESDFLSLLNSYFINLFVTVLPISIASIFFYQIVFSLWNRSQYRSLLSCFLLFWCTILFPYSTMLWGHVTAASFLIISLYFFLRSTPRSAFYSGLFIGMSVLTEYSCFITATTLTLALLMSKSLKRLAFFLGGVAIPFLVFVGYHKICFGSFFTIANFHINPAFLTDQAIGRLFVGLGIETLWGITFSPYRGLFFYMPFLLLVFPSFYIFVKKRQFPPLFWIGTLNIFFYLLLNWSFNGWHGGACIGPRYQIPALPFYVLLIIFLPNNFWIRSLTLVFAIPSFLNMVLSSAIIPMVRQNIQNPLFGFYRAFGKIVFEKQDLLQPYTLPIRLQSADSPIVKKFSAFNWGDLVELSDFYSLFLWLVGFGTLLAITVKSCANGKVKEVSNR